MNDNPFQRCPAAVAFDIFGAAYQSDPYPFYVAARESTPVFHEPRLNMWVILRHSDIERILLDPVRFSSANVHTPVLPFCAEAQQVLNDGGFNPIPVISNADAPTHTRVRKHVVRAFHGRRKAVTGTLIREIVNELIAGFAGAGRVDLVERFAFPLPATVIFTLIGFPSTDFSRIRDWCSGRLSLIWGLPKPAEQIEAACRSTAYWSYCKHFVREHKKTTGDNLTADLLAIHEADATALSEEEIASIIFSLGFAGHETTTRVIANAVRQLLLHPPSWTELAMHPERIENAVEEVLRYDTSIIGWQRTATQDVLVGGVQIPAGARLLLLLGAAGRDPRKYQNPEDFDISRTNAGTHLAFGKGVHLCIGASLARQEVHVALERLTQTFRGLRLSEQSLTFPTSTSFRGPDALFVEWDNTSPNKTSMEGGNAHP